MTIVGRITRDAVVNSTTDKRKVVSFTLAINERYKPKEGEPVKVTTYCNCSYWTTEKVAKNLKKGTLVEVAGRIYVTSYVSTDGTAKASLNCHVNNIKIHAWPKEVEAIGKAVQGPAQEEERDDMPF
jgi:single-strand DNA-binding protein